MKRKRVIAFFVLLLVVLGAAFYGSLHSLDNLREDNDFYYDTSGFSIWNGLTARQDAAINILKIAGNYKEDSTELESRMYELERAVEIFKNTHDKDEMAVENRKLDVISRELVQFVKDNTAVTEKDIRYMDSQLADLKGNQDKINRSSYHEKADAFNARLKSFPGSLLKGLGLIRPLTDYRHTLDEER